jgi:signal transduction histidine kinase
MAGARKGNLLHWAKGLWRNLSRVEPFKRGVLWVILLLPLTTGFVYDGAQFGLTAPRFWLATGVSYALFLTTYVILMLPFSFIPALSRSGTGKLLAYLFAVNAKTAIFAYAFFENPEDALNLVLERAPGDISVAIIFWIAIAVVSVSNSDYHHSLDELNRVTEELEQQRDNRTSAAAFAERRLKQLAITALQSELEKISHGLRSIGQDRDIWRLSAEIKTLIEQKVRPLSRELRNRISVMTDMSFIPKTAIRQSAFATLRVSPRLDTRFWLSYLVSSVNIFLTVGQLTNWYIALTIQAVSLSHPVIGSLLTGLWRRKARIGLSGATVWMISSSLIAYLPTLWILNFWAQQEPTLARIQITAYMILILLLVAFSVWASQQRARDEQLDSIEISNAETKRELALVDQAVWIAQRKWSYLVHGTVQGALTVAGSRLVFSENPGKKVIGQVIKDVERAKRALQEAVEFRMGTRLLAKEISASWEGLCEVDFEIPEPAVERLDGNEAGRTCLMEVSKEWVSNAYRHGKASKVWISVYLTEEGDLKLIMTNNGHQIPADSEPGLGFAMFDELTSEWEIDRSPQSRFTATIPLSS